MLRARFVRLMMVVSFLGSVGCTTIGTLQRANTLGKGGVQFSVEPLVWGVASTTALAVPSIGASLRYGVTDNIDIGAHISLAGVEVLGKFQLTPPKSPVIVSLAPAIGGLGFVGTAGTGADATSAWTGFMNAQLPILVGIPVGPHQVIIAPKLQEYVLFAGASGGSGALGITSVGASLGFAAKLSDGFQLLPEFAIAYPVLGSLGATGTKTAASALTPQGVIFQVALGLLFGGK